MWKWKWTHHCRDRGQLQIYNALTHLLQWPEKRSDCGCAWQLPAAEHPCEMNQYYILKWSIYVPIWNALAYVQMYLCCPQVSVWLKAVLSFWQLKQDTLFSAVSKITALPVLEVGFGFCLMSHVMGNVTRTGCSRLTRPKRPCCWHAHTS